MYSSLNICVFVNEYIYILMLRQWKHTFLLYCTFLLYLTFLLYHTHLFDTPSHITHIDSWCWAATHCNTLQHTATHCNTLQHTATHCNTLQHTRQDAEQSNTYMYVNENTHVRHITHIYSTRPVMSPNYVTHMCSSYVLLTPSHVAHLNIRNTDV